MCMIFFTKQLHFNSSYVDITLNKYINIVNQILINLNLFYGSSRACDRPLTTYPCYSTIERCGNRSVFK